MQQLTQKLKNGSMQVLEVPCPALLEGMILVRNHFSLISAGTEGSTVQAARKSLIGKARERPQQVKQVVETLKTQGPVQTYRAVMKKLDAYSSLGYSCAGEVMEVAPGIKGFSPGDLVACGGLSAAHAEVVAVPANLSVRLELASDLKQAVFNTPGAIAMQGVRQADLRLGETCAVIGLGLLGQITALLLRAAGIRVIGIDVDPLMVEAAKESCTDLALVRNANGIVDQIHQFSDGIGCDAVIITAASNSLDPINFAGTISRKRGSIVIVGAVPTGFDRDPYFYRKELQVRMSCAYGPGRYDPQYEEKGIDYPPAYVRWTEKRNMQAFQELIHSNKIDVRHLSTHVFKLDSALDAYEMMMSKSQPYIGILIEYEKDSAINTEKITLRLEASQKPSLVSIGFIGAGSYAQSQLLPNIPSHKAITLKGVMTSTGISSRSVGERFGFEFCSGNSSDILDNQEINTVFIATRHDSHAEYVLQAIEAGKNVFVEKPLCLFEEELVNIRKAYLRAVERGRAGHVMVGYNRRFSFLSKRIKEEMAGSSSAMICRVNAGAVSKDSWIQDDLLGGGRIMGEVCHFVDLLTFFAGSMPVLVYASAMKDADNLNDTITINLNYENGSVGTICYFANGDKSVPKERLEIYSAGSVGVIEDFRSMTIHKNGKQKGKKLLAQDKGQKTEMGIFFDAVTTGRKSPISFEEICSTSLVTFKILESLRTGNAVKLL